MARNQLVLAAANSAAVYLVLPAQPRGSRRKHLVAVVVVLPVGTLGSLPDAAGSLRHAARARSLGCYRSELWPDSCLEVGPATGAALPPVPPHLGVASQMSERFQVPSY